MRKSEVKIMDMINVLWQVGVLAAVLVFGVKVGLASGMANYSKKIIALIAIMYGIGVFIITQIASLYSAQITEFVYAYNSVFFLVMATIMIVAGVLTIREWKVHEKNTSTAAALAVIAPCPCCFLSIVVSILMVAPTVGLGVNDLSPFVALALSITIIISYFASGLFMKIVKKPYPVVLGNFMFFLGLYFLVSALFLPNISSALQKNMGSITIESTGSIVWIVIIAIILVVLGVILTKKNSFLR
jgi:predicted transporter